MRDAKRKLILIGRAVRDRANVNPPEYSGGLFEAVRTSVRWAFTAPEPSIIVDRDEAIPITRVCESRGGVH
jgi:hypothetical protein